MSAPARLPSPAAPRRKQTPSRLSADVKSGLYVSVKWPLPEDTFALKVPSREKAAITYLRQHAGEPSVAYLDLRGKRDALQWHLPLSKYRAVYRAAGKDVR